MSNPVNQEAYDEVERVVLAASALWVPRLQLEAWDIRHKFLDSQFTEDMPNDDWLITALTEARPSYFMASIKWFLPSAIRHAQAELEKVVVHELCHVVLSPEQSLLELKHEELAAEVSGEEAGRLLTLMFDRVEQSTELMTRALVRAYAA